jgi:hypothetical protein
MKIVRAMKEKSRLEGEIKQIKHRIQSCISTISGNSFSEDFPELFALLTDRLNKLAGLKNAIMKANVSNGMHRNIVQLGELKQYLVFLRELDPKSGKQEAHYSEVSESYNSQITLKEKNDVIQATQSEINRITDLLDDFNAKTDIGEIEEIALTLPKIKV